MDMKRWIRLICVLLCVVCLNGCSVYGTEEEQDSSKKQTISYENKSENYYGKWAEETGELQEEHTQITTKEEKVTSSEIPEFSGEAFIVLNDNQPEFSAKDMKKEPFESYSPLDSLKRCGAAYAKIGKELMPTEERGAIAKVKPVGWHAVKYDCVEGKYLYNRCHLIGFQLTGENANERNLITGTRYMNIDGMLDFENLVADYIRKNSNHVLYRVTPVYEGDNLIAKGLQMEAYSVEDKGEGVCYNVFVYNSQPGVEIDYSTGESHLSNKAIQKSTKKPQKQPVKKIIGNKNSKTYHQESCSRLPKEQNRIYFNSKEEAKAAGYDNPCGFCNP